MVQQTYLRPGKTDVSPGFPLASRLPRLLPFIFFQIMLFLAMFQIYKVVRKTFIARAENVAFGNTRDVLHFEAWPHLDFELHLQMLGSLTARLGHQIIQSVLCELHVCLLRIHGDRHVLRRRAMALSAALVRYQHGDRHSVVRDLSARIISIHAGIWLRLRRYTQGMGTELF